MNNINGINGYSGLRAVASALNARENQGQSQQQQSEGRLDEVEISSAARFMSKIASMPEIRSEKVAEIQAALADGSYDLDGNLDAAVERMLEEELG